MGAAVKLEAYLHHWHLIKLRKMELRRILFSDISLFGLETAALHQRKIIEGIAQSWVLLAEKGGVVISDKLKFANNPINIRNRLKKCNFLFPKQAQIVLIGKTQDGKNNQWHVNVIENGSELSNMISEEYLFIHDFLHEISPYKSFPFPDNFSQYLNDVYRRLALNHQKIWNAYWEHMAYFDDRWIHISLGDGTNTGRPRLIKLQDIDLSEELSAISAPVETVTGWKHAPDWTTLKQNI